jgi:excisionase family DNA binding protein
MTALTSKQVAEQLGVLPITVVRWAKRGKLKASRPGRNYLFEQAAVDEMIRENAVKVKERTA